MAASYSLDGQPLPFGAFTTGGVHYPAQVLLMWTDSELAHIGVTRRVDPELPPGPPPPPEPPPPGPPPPVRICSVFELMYGRVTTPERIAIRASTNPVVVDFVAALEVISQVELDGPLTVQGVNYLESVGLLAPGRAAEILA